MPAVRAASLMARRFAADSAGFPELIPTARNADTRHDPARPGHRSLHRVDADGPIEPRHDETDDGESTFWPPGISHTGRGICLSGLTKSMSQRTACGATLSRLMLTRQLTYLPTSACLDGRATRQRHRQPKPSFNPPATPPAPLPIHRDPARRSARCKYPPDRTACPRTVAEYPPASRCSSQPGA